jgi:CRP/FNR family cyclic AMP-dependent transcriptional regulator
MKERFEGQGSENLLTALQRQEFIGNSHAIAERFAAVGKLLEVPKGDPIILQDGEDNDLFFLIAGSVAIIVKGTQVAVRIAGQHVGEMAAIEPAQKRSATVVATETVVTLKVSAHDFHEIGKEHPEIWLPLARELSRRLKQRNDLMSPPNDRPRLFIISTVEALDTAYEIARQLEREALCTVWTNGVFFAGGFTLEALEKAVAQSDFAVAVAQADDVVESRDSRSPTVRDNVIFELGLFMGHLTRHRAVLLHPRTKGLKLPSDLQGLTLLSYELGKPDDLPSLIGPACHELRKLVRSLGVRSPNEKR